MGTSAFAANESFLNQSRSIECRNGDFIYEYVFTGDNILSNFWTLDGQLITKLDYSDSNIEHGRAIADYDENSKILLINVHLVTVNDEDLEHTITAYIPDFKNQSGFTFQAWLSANPAMVLDSKLTNYIESKNPSLELQCKIM